MAAADADEEEGEDSADADAAEESMEAAFQSEEQVDLLQVSLLFHIPTIFISLLFSNPYYFALSTTHLDRVIDGWCADSDRMCCASELSGSVSFVLWNSFCWFCSHPF